MCLGSQFVSGCTETWIVACLIQKPKPPRERDPEREAERVRGLPDMVPTAGGQTGEGGHGGVKGCGLAESQKWRGQAPGKRPGLSESRRPLSPHWASSTGNSTLTAELQEAEVFIMDNKKCDQIYRKRSPIPHIVPLVLGDMVCATNYGENLCSVSFWAVLAASLLGTTPRVGLGEVPGGELWLLGFPLCHHHQAGLCAHLPSPVTLILPGTLGRVYNGGVEGCSEILRK